MGLFKNKIAEEIVDKHFVDFLGASVLTNERVALPVSCYLALGDQGY